MELYTIVKKLAGSISPQGQHEVDTVRLENLKDITKLIDELVKDIRVVAQCADSHALSVKAIGKHAKSFMDELREG